MCGHIYLDDDGISNRGRRPRGYQGSCRNANSHMAETVECSSYTWRLDSPLTPALIIYKLQLIRPD